MWNWFQNRRYALRAKSAKPPMKLNVSPMPQHDSAAVRNVSQPPQIPSVPAGQVFSLIESCLKLFCSGILLMHVTILISLGYSDP